MNLIKGYDIQCLYLHYGDDLSIKIPHLKVRVQLLGGNTRFSLVNNGPFGVKQIKV